MQRWTLVLPLTLSCLTVINDVKTYQMEILANTISSIHADKQELTTNDVQKHSLTQELYQSRAVFCAKSTEIQCLQFPSPRQDLVHP